MDATYGSFDSVFYLMFKIVANLCFSDFNLSFRIYFSIGLN